jgi:hypothetical protein
MSTNRFFAEDDTMFRNSCKKTGTILFPTEKTKAEEFASKIRTTRQASKFRRGKGIVYKAITNTLTTQ